MNRLSRDAIIIRALDMADSAVLDQKDRPSGTVVSAALSIGWLQDGLDYIHHLYPWGGTIGTASIAIALDGTSAALPSDFILDYKNGLIITSEKRRVRRRGLSQIIGGSADTRDIPLIYSIHTPNIRWWPASSKALTGTLWYYKLPAALADTTVPNFPSDWVLVEYLYMRAREWSRALPSGAAMAFLKAHAADLQKAGIGNEAEDEQIGDTADVIPSPMVYDPLAWMGKPNL